MRRKAIQLLLFAVVAIILAIGPGVRAEQLVSFKHLIGTGYEIKNILLIPIDMAERWMGVANAIVLVTLQKGSSTAACSYHVSNWHAQAPQSLESQSCGVYPPQ